MKSLLVVAFCLFASLTGFSQSFNTKSYPVGLEPMQLITADFNGDHIPDLATANFASNTVSILINNGDGTFRPQLQFATGQSPIGIAAVDWNKDGKMDLVVVNVEADPEHKVSILLGNGDGTFQPHQDIPGAPNAITIAAGDFNHDGNPDIATGENLLGNAVYVSLGNGKGGVLAQKITSNIGLSPQPPADNSFRLSKIVLADFNRDGKDDLYYIECCNTSGDELLGAFGVLVGNGDGTFTDRHSTGPILRPNDLVAVDINQDGLTDAVVPFLRCANLCLDAGVFINNGDGTFRGGAGSNVGIVHPGVVAGAAFDVDGDGLKDFVFLSNSLDNPPGPLPTIHMIVQKQNADGSFAKPPEAPGGPTELVDVALNAPLMQTPLVVVADFNHDGKPDLAIAEAADVPVFVALNTTPSSPCTVGTSNHSVTVCHPADGAVGLSPAHIVSHFTSSTAASVSQIYLDNKLVFQVAGGNINKNLALTPGEHRLEVKSWTKGQPFHNDFFLSTPRSIPATVPPCSESTNFRVNICSPGQKAAVDAPVHVVAAAKSTAPITTMQIYLDFKEVFHSPNSTLIETDVPMGSGSHFLIVKAWDSTGRSFSSSRNISVP
jgi:hypothetical protein